jgi:hypothetical protein
MPCVNTIYPTFDSLDEVLSVAEGKLPIQTKNDLMWLVFVINNTLVKINET